MAKFDIGGFLCACYLNAEPSVDLTQVPDGEKVDCCAHKLKLSVYNRLLQEWGVTDKDGKPTDNDLHLGVQFIVMDKGPSWVDDLPKAA